MEQKSYRLHDRCVAEIDLDAIRHNIFELRLCHAAHTKKVRDYDYAQTLVTVKANAYGHGAAEVAEGVRDLVDYFAVACTAEGIELRKHGITEPILLLGPVFPEDLEAAVAHDLTLTVFDLARARALSDCAERLGRTVYIHTAVDTGMSRIGVSADEAGLETIREIRSLPNLILDGIFMHFATADAADKSGAEEALRRFTAFREMCEQTGIRIPVWHCANTAAIIDGVGADRHMGMIRCGIGIYGLYPSDEVDREQAFLRPALRWKSYLSYIKEIPAGTSVSYGYNYTAPADRKIGTVCCGYADGYPRLLSFRGGEVLVGGKRCPIVGNICMDQFMVDVTEVPDAAVGDEVVLIGRQGDETISADELAEKCGTISYEIVCGISPRVKRRYKKTVEQERL